MVESTGWIKQAIDGRVISEAEAREICLTADRELVTVHSYCILRSTAR